MSAIDYPDPGQVTHRLVTRASLPEGHPNLDPETDRIPIDPISLFCGDRFENVIVFPGLIEVQRFEKALAQILAVWPSLTSHYMMDEDGSFYWDTSNLTVPLSIQSVQREAPFPTLDIMQPSLDPYLECLDPKFTLANTGASQVSFRLTRILPSDQSVLGVEFSHQLGDGHTAHRFLRHFSECYANGLDSIPRSDYPSYYPHIQISPITDPGPPPSQYPRTLIPIMDCLKHNDQLHEKYSLSTFGISLKEVEAMRTEARSKTDTALSTSSLILAWWATVQERRDGWPRDKLAVATNTIRSCFNRPEFPPNLPTLAANCISFILVDCPSSSDLSARERMVEIAVAMREKVKEYRKDPDSVLDMIAKWTRSKTESMRTGMGSVMVIPDSISLTNSLLAFYWIFDFGFPKAQVSYHSMHPRPHAGRLYRANCEPGKSSQDTGYELSTYTPKDQPEMIETMEEIVRNDRVRWASLQG